MYMKVEQEAQNKEWLLRLEYISSQITKIPTVTTSYPPMEIANHVPHMRIKWGSKKIPMTPHEVGKALRAGKPSIVLSTGEHGEALSLSSFMLQSGEEKIIAAESVKVFKAHH